MPGIAAAYHVERGLNVGRRRLDSRHPSRYYVRRGLVADESAQYSNNGGLTGGGILHTNLQREDTTKPDLYRLRAKVSDSCIVTVSDLSLLCYLQLNICCLY